MTKITYEKVLAEQYSRNPDEHPQSVCMVSQHLDECTGLFDLVRDMSDNNEEIMQETDNNN